MSFEYFNTEELWETEDCYNNVDFFVCEKPYPVDADIKEEKCKSLPKKEDHNALPYSGRSCQNWQNLSNNAKNDFDKMFSSIRISLENSNVCENFGQGISWCYVNDPGEFIREPCFLHQSKFDSDNDKKPVFWKRMPEVNCSDGSSIPLINWCDRNFDCLDYSDELSCQNNIKDHNLVNTMTNSNLTQRLKNGTYFTCKNSREQISLLANCDDVIDCLDASDESGCLHSNIECDENEFSCDGGHCIQLSQVCDLISDCADGTDEFCDFQACKVNEFTCENKQCISEEKRCNAVSDCFDYSDEINCDSCKHSFLCADDYKCIPLRLTCDRYPDCKDASDERHCHVNPPTSNVFTGNDYLWSLHTFTGLCYWNWDFWGNSSKESISGCTSFAKHEVFNPQREVIIDYSIYYSCFTQVQIECGSHFHDADLDLFNDFEYEFCYCILGTVRYKVGSIVGRYDLVSVTRCDGSQMTEIHVVEESIYLQSDSGNDVYVPPPSDLLDDTNAPAYCTYGYNMTEFGDFFHCKRDGKIIPKSMRCIYAVDNSGYMTGCRSGDHLQNCEKINCPENTVKCPGSYCIEQRFLCDGHTECPGGEDEQNCSI
ncbi:sortilin-related receptor-like [Ruditapes philippinarum]|uniref:sortilin-related receptor-like n=1 Tax=Ruditapes philippinarum TaxID=129788 RepID=UPI00295AD5D9|nr:sortilin-related receptor-like [Ruditapes philippinarum]